MPRQLRNYTLTLVSLSLTFAIEILANFVFNLTSEQQFIIISVGLIVSVAVLAIEHQMPILFSEHLDERIAIYSLLSKIEDPEFYGIAVDLIARTKYHLALLAQGEFRTSISFGFKWGRLERAKEQLRAVHLGTIYQLLGRHTWTKVPEEQRYYQENLAALAHRIRITRIFILKKSRTLDEKASSIIDVEIFNEMKRQQDDGIEVNVVWEEEILAVAGRELLKDFVILDAHEVDAREYSSDGSYEAIIYKSHTKIREYESTFDTLLTYSQPFTIMDALYKNPNSVDPDRR